MEKYYLHQELTLQECMEIVSDYEIKDQQVLQKVKNLYLRQDMVSLVSAST
jgi:hypothetical protein